jgi:hypothetical protein
MKTRLKADESGALVLPATILPNPSPHAEYSILTAGSSVIIESAETPNNFWRLKPEERAAKFADWIESHKDGPGLSDWAVSRDSIYD